MRGEELQRRRVPMRFQTNKTKQGKVNSKCAVCSRQGLLSMLEPKASLVAAVGAPRFSRGRGFAGGRKNFRPVHVAPTSMAQRPLRVR